MATDRQFYKNTVLWVNFMIFDSKYLVLQIFNVFPSGLLQLHYKKIVISIHLPEYIEFFDKFVLVIMRSKNSSFTLSPELELSAVCAPCPPLPPDHDLYPALPDVPVEASLSECLE